MENQNFDFDPELSEYNPLFAEIAGLKEKAAHLDEGEFLGVEKVPFEKAYQMAINGGIRDSKTLIAIYAYAAKRARGEL